MPSASEPISTIAELGAQLAALQQAADESSSVRPGRIPMGQLFALAKDFIGASPEQIEVLLDRPDHPPRVVAVSVWISRRGARRHPTAGGETSISSICDAMTGSTPGISSTGRRLMSSAVTYGTSRGNRSISWQPPRTGLSVEVPS